MAALRGFATCSGALTVDAFKIICYNKQRQQKILIYTAEESEQLSGKSGNAVMQPTDFAFDSIN